MNAGKQRAFNLLPLPLSNALLCYCCCCCCDLRTVNECSPAQGQNQDLSQCQRLRDALARSAVCLCFARGFGARDFHTNVIKSSTTLKLNTSHGANGVMIFYVELDADNGTIAALTPLLTSPLTRPPPLALIRTPARPHLRLQPPCLAACFPDSVCSLGGFVFVCVVIEINPSIEVEFNLAQNGKRVCVRPALDAPRSPFPCFLPCLGLPWPCPLGGLLSWLLPSLYS